MTDALIVGVTGQVEVDGRRQGVDGTATAEVYADPRGTVFAAIGELPAIFCGLATLGLVGWTLVSKVGRRPKT